MDEKTKILLNNEIKKYDFLFSAISQYNSNPNHDRFKIAKKFISQIKVNSILDVGVGRGHFFKEMQGNGYFIQGIEPSNEARKILNDPNIKFGYSHQIPYDTEDYDVVVCLDVLEHVPYILLEDTLKEISRVSRKYAIISVANHSDVVEGLEVHISKMPFCKWRDMIIEFFLILRSEIVCSKADITKTSEVYLLKKNK